MNTLKTKDHNSRTLFFRFPASLLEIVQQLFNLFREFQYFRALGFETCLHFGLEICGKIRVLFKNVCHNITIKTGLHTAS